MIEFKKKCEKNAFFISLLALTMLGVGIYISEASRNVPIMDYWRFLNILVSENFTGGISFSDVYANNGVHRTPVELILFLLNVNIFHWNTQISMYFGIIVIALEGVVLYKYIGWIKLKNRGILGATFLIIIFSLGPFEILTQEFSTSFALRMFFFVWGFYIADRKIKGFTTKFDTSLYFFFVFNIITICGLGGAYSVAYSVSIVLMVIFDFFSRRNEKKNVYNYIVLVSGIVFGEALYVYGLNVTTAGEVSRSIGELLVSCVKGIIIVNGASVIGSESGNICLYVVGLIVVFVHVLCVYAYIMKKMYQITYLPILIYIYCGIFYGMIFFARGGYGIEYLSSSRYIMDSSLALIADVCIIVYFWEKQDNKKNGKSIIGCLCIISIVIGIGYTDYTEFGKAKYRKIYCDNLINMMLNIDEYSDDELISFQANSPEQVRDGIEIMKKYKLGIFRKEEK